MSPSGTSRFYGLAAAQRSLIKALRRGYRARPWDRGRSRAAGGFRDFGGLSLAVRARRAGRNPVSSPRAWGWTAGQGDLPSPLLSSPQAWGGPPAGLRSGNPRPSSPRAWGWTVDVAEGGQAGNVVPTGVGVDRRTAGRHVDSRLSSPWVWGWTDPAPPRVGGDHQVVPTGVGVDRWQLCSVAGWLRRPHGRGGGPDPWSTPVFTGELSPTRVGV